MGLEELTHTIVLWVALFYSFAIMSYINRVILLAEWDVWLVIVGFSLLVGFSMLAAHEWQPMTTIGYNRSSETNHTIVKLIRIYVAFILMVLISFPFETLKFSPTPLEDFLLLTLTSYVWLVYVAILIISVIFYDKMNGFVSKENENNEQR